MTHVFIFLSLLVPLRADDPVVFNVVGVPVFVKEGDSVTLHVDDTSDKREMRYFLDITWSFNYNRIAVIDYNYFHNENHSRICTDVQCKDGDERFRDRLKLDHQTGSLTIRDIRTTDSGLYYLDGFGFHNLEKIFIVAVHGVFGVGSDGRSVFVMEGDSVTLNTDVKTKQNTEIRWYFNKDIIAEINRDLNKICTDVQCKDGDERFRDRLRLDHQTGSLTITNTRTTDSGLYAQQINHRSHSSLQKFAVVVHEVPAAERDQMKTKSVKEGKSFLLNPDPVLKNPNDLMTWYFNDTPIAEITEDHSRSYTDVQCKDGDERFRGRLKLDHQTGSLTITNTRITDSGVYKLKISSRISSISIIRSFSVTVIVTGGGSVSVMEGDSVTLQTGIKTKTTEMIEWYFNGFQIAEITGDLHYICTDVQCEDADERFRDRLNLDHQTGSLTITNTRNTDSGLYKLQINSRRGKIRTKIFIVAVSGFLGVGEDGLSAFVMEEDSVTLHSDIKTNQQTVIKWIMNDIRIAVITGDLSYICTDVQCNEGTESFRNRLKLDHKTGSLTIANISITDSGFYQLEISNTNKITFGVQVHKFSAAKRDEIKRKSVKEGESVTLDTYLIKTPHHSLSWYFNDTCIAEISGNQSKICTDVQCEDGNERFRNRLKVDHSSGSLTITNSRITDSGDYQLNITSRRISIIRHFSVSVTADLTGIYGAVSTVLLLVIASAGLIYSCKCHSRRKHIRTQCNDQVHDVEDFSPNQTESISPASQTSQTETDAVNEAPT
ncbi:uncharacterized protein LOC127159115 [Labeo rohita]|uniref:uncharacterized protein LOC127159115 n=1 Tax=Labeo rohita TaxID=84645 RepID=UPI0021E2F640|nr:uncharacterized protein LOC127159115 [Labeo rohita]